MQNLDEEIWLHKDGSCWRCKLVSTEKLPNWHLYCAFLCCWYKPCHVKLIRVRLCLQMVFLVNNGIWFYPAKHCWCLQQCLRSPGSWYCSCLHSRFLSKLMMLPCISVAKNILLLLGVVGQTNFQLTSHFFQWVLCKISSDAFTVIAVKRVQFCMPCSF